MPAVLPLQAPGCNRGETSDSTEARSIIIAGVRVCRLWTSEHGVYVTWASWARCSFPDQWLRSALSSSAWEPQDASERSGRQAGELDQGHASHKQAEPPNGSVAVCLDIFREV